MSENKDADKKDEQAPEQLPAEQEAGSETVAEGQRPAGDQQDNDAPRGERAPGKRKPPPPKRRSARQWPAVLALLVALAALAGAGANYYFSQAELAALERTVRSAEATQHSVEETAEELRAVRGNVDELRQSLQSLRQADRRLENQLEQQLQSQLGDIDERIGALQQQLRAVTATDRREWQLAEAEYLLQLANQRLLMADDAQAAIELLQAADDILRQLDDDALFPVRRAIARELESLRAVPELDTQGVFLRLEALAERAAGLPLVQPPQAPAPTEDVADEAMDWQGRVRSNLAEAWNALSSAVRIRRRDDIYRPQLAPEQEAALRYSVQLMFEQAQLALLAQNGTLYRQSLDQAQEWLRRYYTLDTDATAAVVQATDELSQVTVARQLPDVADSRQALKRYMERRHLQSGGGTQEEPAAQDEGGAP